MITERPLTNNTHQKTHVRECLLEDSSVFVFNETTFICFDFGTPQKFLITVRGETETRRYRQARTGWRRQHYVFHRINTRKVDSKTSARI